MHPFLDVLFLFSLLLAQTSAQEMFTRIWEMKFLPPGRGLWAMGSPVTEQRGLYAALNNCAFVSKFCLVRFVLPLKTPNA